MDWLRFQLHGNEMYTRSNTQAKDTGYQYEEKVAEQKKKGRGLIFFRGSLRKSFCLPTALTIKGYIEKLEFSFKIEA